MKKLADGFHDVPEADYHKRPEISKHGLDLIHRCPAAYKHAPEINRTAAMILGSALHCAALEPERYASEYIVSPLFDRRTKKGKADFAEFSETVGDKEVLTADVGAQVASMVDALRKNSSIARLLDADGEAEKTLIFKNNGIACRSRIDKILTDGKIIDLKTAQSAEPNDFGRDSINYRYDVQAAFYVDAVQILTGEVFEFWFPVIEKKSNLTALYRASSEFLERGRRGYLRDLEIYKRCSDMDVWPEYEIGDITMPAWARD